MCESDVVGLVRVELFHYREKGAVIGYDCKLFAVQLFFKVPYRPCNSKQFKFIHAISCPDGAEKKRDAKATVFQLP